MKTVNNNEIVKKFLNKYKLNKYFLEESVRYFNLKKYSKGEIVISANDEVRNLYFIVSGEVEIHSFLASGRSIFINKLTPPENFGDVEYFGNLPMLFDVIASTETIIINISFRELENNIKFNSQLWKYLGTTSTKKLLKTNQAILLKEGFNLKNILALYLVKNNYTITFNSLMDLSQELNVSYRNLTRVIKFFVNENIIVKERKKITAINKIALNKYINEI